MINADIDFFIYGPPKTGSSSLIFMLDQHPNIKSIIGVKEPAFFNRDHILDQDIINYNNAFPEKNNKLLTCEKSTGYFASSQAIKNIKQYCNSNIKFITILRNPIDRFISYYRHFKIISKILANVSATHTMRDIAQQEGWLAGWMQIEEDNLKSNNHFIDMPHISDIIKNTYPKYWWTIIDGFYDQHLQRFYQYYDKSYMRIFFYDDWKNNNQKILIDICNFLNLDTSFFEKGYERLEYNSSNNWLNYLKQCNINYNPIDDISNQNINDLYMLYKESNTRLKSILDINPEWNDKQNSFDIR